MERIRTARFLWVATVLIALGYGSALADVITLKNGEVIRCTFLGGTARTIRAEVGGVIKTFDVGQIATVSFLDDSSTSTAVLPRTPALTGIKAVIPANTFIVVRTIDAVDSASSHAGQTFSAAIDEPVVVNGTEVIPKDSSAQMRIVSESVSVAHASLKVVLSTITVNGKILSVSTSDVQPTTSGSAATQTARIGSGTSAVAGIAGTLGGQGVSTIGSAAGSAISTAGRLSVHGAKVKIPAGTHLIFRIQSQVTF